MQLCKHCKYNQINIQIQIHKHSKYNQINTQIQPYKYTGTANKIKQNIQIQIQYLYVSIWYFLCVEQKCVECENKICEISAHSPI